MEILISYKRIVLITLFAFIMGSVNIKPIYGIIITAIFVQIVINEYDAIRLFLKQRKQTEITFKNLKK